MEFIKIAGTSLVASRIGLGTWAIGGWMWGGTDEEQSIRTIHEALDRGVTLFDTAPVYGFGRAEEILGKALSQDGRRERAVIATKAGLECHSTPFRNAGRGRIVKEVEESSRRLQTDVIDLYQVHWPDPKHSHSRDGGGYGGPSSRREDPRHRGAAISARAKWTSFAPSPRSTLSSRHTICFERAIENNVLPYAVDRGIVTLAYGVLCRGLLSGRMTNKTRFSGDDLRNQDPKFSARRRQQYLKAVEKLARFARDRYDKEVIHLAARWVLDRAKTNIALWGARRPDQSAPISGVMGWKIDQAGRRDSRHFLEELITSPLGPEFMAPSARRAA